MMKPLFVPLFLFCIHIQGFCGLYDLLTNSNPPQIIRSLIPQENLDDLKNHPISDDELNLHINRLSFLNDVDDSQAIQILGNQITELSDNNLKKFYSYINISNIASNCELQFKKSDTSEFIANFKKIPDYYSLKRSKKPDDWVLHIGALLYIKDLLIGSSTAYKNKALSKDEGSRSPLTLENLRTQINAMAHTIPMNKQDFVKILGKMSDHASFQAFQLLNNKQMLVTGVKKGVIDDEDINQPKLDSISLKSEGSNESLYEEKKSFKYRCTKLFWKIFCCCSIADNSESDDYKPIIQPN